MKRIKRLSPEAKKAMRGNVRSKINYRLPKEVKENFVSEAPSFDPPETEGLGDFDVYAESACEVVGVPFELDPQKVYHHVGNFTGSSSIDTVDAFVQVYNVQRTPRKYIFNYDEYLGAIKRVSRIQAQLNSIEKHRQSEEERWHKHQEKYEAWLASESDKPAPTYYERPEPEPPPSYDIDFLYAYDLAIFKQNLSGYLKYIASLAPDLWTILDKPIPFYLEENPDKPHGYVLGTPGSGKSELLKLLIHTYITHTHYGSVVVIDPTSDFATQIAHWKEFNTSDRLVYIKPTFAKGLAPVINPFEIYGIEATDYSEEALNVKRVVAQELTEALGYIVGDLSGPMANVLRNCILVLLDKEGATIEDLHDFMSRDSNHELVEYAQSLTHHERLPGYFSGKDSGFNIPANKVTKDAVARRIDGLLQTGQFRKVTCGRSTIQIEKAIEERKVILFDLARGSIGQDESTALGRLIIAMLLSMAYRRADLSEKERVPVSLVIDECQNFVTKSMENILNDTRKYRLMMTLAQQIAGQRMPIELKETVLQGTNMLIVGRSMRGGAKRNAEMVSVDAPDIERLETGEFYTMPKGYAPAVKFKTRTELLKFKNSVTKPTWKLTALEQLEKYYRGNLKKADIEFEEEPDISPQKWD